MSRTSSQAVVYRIDADDTIVSVNDAWRRFARENGAPSLADGALGRPLWGFVSGEACRHVWEILLARVRRGAAVGIPYRCDSPDLRRFMEMTLRALPGGAVELVSLTLSVEPRGPVPLLVGDGDGEPVRSCSWCRKFFVDGWVEAEEAVTRLGLLERPTPPVTHGICPDCEARVVAELLPT